MPDAGIDEAAAYAAIDRCWNIEWRENPARLESTIALVREYLRRSAVVAEAVGDTLNWPWFDAASRLTLPGRRPALSARLRLSRCGAAV